MAFWTASLDVLRGRIADYEALAAAADPPYPGGVPSRYDVDPRRAGVGCWPGEPRYRVDQVWHGLYEQLAAPDELTSLPEGAAGRASTTALPPALTS